MGFEITPVHYHQDYRKNENKNNGKVYMPPGDDFHEANLRNTKYDG
jgi:hypothetical protein